MDFLYYLLKNFLKEENMNTAILLVLSLLITLLQTNGISYTTARIIEGVHAGNISSIFTNYKLFVCIAVLFVVLIYIYKQIQTKLLQKLIQWTRNEMLKLILKSNNENISNVNFSEFFAPITRTSIQLHLLFHNIISLFIPTISVLMVITVYFIYKNPTLGIGFLISNILLLSYVSYYWSEMVTKKKEHERILSTNEIYLTDILKNIDKVIYRGQVNKEVDNYTDINNVCLDASIKYMNYMNQHTIFIISYINLIVFGSAFYLITLQTSKKLDVTTFVTFFTILLLYRERVSAVTSELHEYVDFSGRLEHVSSKFKEMTGDLKNMTQLANKTYTIKQTQFDTVTFKDVKFKYQGTDKWIFDGLNLKLQFNHNIIGITGMSGKGKTSFVKLMLRLHDYNEGSIYIDDHEIRTLDPDYIRSNITYVNQTGKLFDKKVIDNILYGCNNLDKCNSVLQEILQYDKIRQLFKNVDFKETPAGSLGENLSGGQRQVVNIISGLIHPSSILILDEPTNALDPELKQQMIAILGKFKEYKKSIIVITHDKDMYTLFDQVIKV